MFERMDSLFHGTMLPRDSGATGHEVRLASCALLLELAYADDAFTPEERLYIEHTVRRQFGLDHEHAEELLLMADWQRRLDGGVTTFARLISEHYSTGQKMVLAEVMWSLVHADGSLALREEQLMAKVVSLLGFRPEYLMGDQKEWGAGGATFTID